MIKQSLSIPIEEAGTSIQKKVAALPAAAAALGIIHMTDEKKETRRNTESLLLKAYG